MMKFFNSLLINLPASKGLGYFWNFGSFLGFILFYQIFTGVFLVFFYTADSNISFDSVQYLMIEVNLGWIFRLLHFNGASLFFVLIYLHIFKALFMNSFRLKFTWVSGLTIFLLLMGVAFMGYVLVWAQMSFWASVVITSLLSVIPIWGSSIVYWIWGGFTVVGATLKFFFVLHFLLPWFMLMLVFIHLIMLHSSGSSSKLLMHSKMEKISFYNYYWFKDSLNFLGFLFFFVFVFFFPFLLGDFEMMIEANYMMSPVHIVPEWYYLFAYAILRAIPNKILGVLALLFSILIFYFFVFINTYQSVMKKMNKYLVFLFIFISFFLSWLGQCLVEAPYVFLSGLMTFFYFFIIFILMFFYWVTNLVMY